MTTTPPRRPWSPIPLVLVALVGGLPGAGILLGINWYRLGRPDRGRNLLLLAALLTVVGAVVLAALHARGRIDGVTADTVGAGAGIVQGWHVLQVGIALLAALQQRPAFERFLAEASPTSGMGAALAESILSMVLGAVAGLLVHRAIVSLAVRIFAGRLVGEP